jgi:hypothetical protein
MSFIQALVRSCAGAYSGPRLLTLLIFSAKRHDLGVFLQPQRKVEGRAAFGASLSNAMLGIGLHPPMLNKFVDCIHAVFELARGDCKHDLGNAICIG